MEPSPAKKSARARTEVAQLTGSVGLAFSEDADFDELDDLGRRAGRDRFGRKVRTSPPAPAANVARRWPLRPSSSPWDPRPVLRHPPPRRPAGAAAVVVDRWHHFFSGWQSVGVGTTAPAAPLFGLAGITGTVFFGAMGTLQHVLLLGCIPLGAWGVARFMRPLVSAGRVLVAVICYLGLPLPYGALGSGRWDGLVAYAAFPFIALRLARRRRASPFEVEPGPRWRTRPVGQVADPRRRHRRRGRASRRPSSPWSFAGRARVGDGPLLVGGRDPGWRVLVVAIEAVVVALLLDAPWVIGHRAGREGRRPDLRPTHRRRRGARLG